MVPDATWPLTEAQDGLWYAQALDPDNPVFNTGQFIDLTGPLDLAAFARAHASAVAQTAALRLRFGTRDGVPQQWLGDTAPDLEIVDLSPRPDPEAEARRLMAQDSATPVDLAAGPVARFVLYRLGPDRAFWYERIHHLAIDGFGFVLFTNRVGDLYSAETGARPAPAPFPPFDQALTADADYRKAPRRTKDAAFWRDRMADLDTVASPGQSRALSADRFDRSRIVLDDDLCRLLRNRADSAGVSWPDVLTLLTASYLSRVSGDGAQVFGLPFMARMGTAAAMVPCTWMNVLPFRFDTDQDAPLDESLKQGAAEMAQLRRHGRYRSEQLRRDLGRASVEARLFGPLINVQPFDLPPRFAGLGADLHILGAGAVDDLTVTFRGDAVETLTLEIDSNPSLYTKADGHAHAIRLAAFLRAALQADRLADVPTVTEAERDAILARGDATRHPVPDVTLTALITRRMAETPEAEAVVLGDTVLSYAELDRRSAALAGALRSRGAGPGRVVAVALPRSEHLAVALVAILRAGAAYVPLDPEDPPARRDALLLRTGAVVLLAETGTDGTQLTPFAPGDWPRTGSAPADEVAPHDPAYVLFTSGSTGEPKGVIVPHRAIVNRLLWMQAQYSFGPHDRILQKTPTTFDVSVWELFLPALCGGTLVFAPPQAHRDPMAIAALIRRHGITAVHFVPSMLSAFLDAPASQDVRPTRVFCSGEALSADLRDRFHRRIDAQLHNLYGPTEAAVDVTWWDAGPQDRSDPLPIGHPVWNTRLLVLDDRLRLVPPGVPGQLYLGGVQLATGYLGRDDLTAERFIPDPFRAGERLYATGDIALARAEDGAVVYLGRADGQVKIRGMRIETGEIEAAIRATGLVREAAVLPHPAARTSRLVAYVVPAAGFAADLLKDALGTRLPAHMVPASVVAMESFPLTTSGKLDRKALPAPDGDLPVGTPPRGPVETALADLFHDLLSLPARPGREADFFALGGDSLSAVQLVLRIEETLGHDPGLGQIFETPDIASLARSITLADEARSGLDPLLPLVRQGSGGPLFLLHPAGGLGWGYRTLAHSIGGDRPVWAVQAPMLSGAAPADSLKALAADHAARIASAAPGGIIHLAGWSVGGILAHEIAVTLRKQGREVGVVALLDAYPAECWRAEPEPDDAAALRALLAIAGHDPDAHPDLDTRSAVVAFLRRGGTPLGSLAEPVLDAVVRLVIGTNGLIRAHHHRRYDGDLVHYRAARDHLDRDLVAAHWAPHAGAIDAIDLPFLHAQMISPEATARIAPDLTARMARAEARAVAK